MIRQSKIERISSIHYIQDTIPVKYITKLWFLHFNSFSFPGHIYRVLRICKICKIIIYWQNHKHIFRYLWHSLLKRIQGKIYFQIAFSCYIHLYTYNINRVCLSYPQKKAISFLSGRFISPLSKRFQNSFLNTFFNLIKHNGGWATCLTANRVSHCIRYI